MRYIYSKNWQWYTSNKSLITVQNFNIKEHPHKRKNILTNEWVLVSPHRAKRPWQGKVEAIPQGNSESYDSKCYLCSNNLRADGTKNPDYKGTYVFTNDFSALLQDSPEGTHVVDGLLESQSEKGICKVIVFSEKHNLSIPELDIDQILDVVKVWKSEFIELSKYPWIKNIQIFENKGEIMGCSNPHPHGQIWAGSSIPQEIEKEILPQKEYFEKHQRGILQDYLKVELEAKERIVIENEHFVALVPYWAVWPFEVLVISKKRMVQNITQFTEDELKNLAEIIQGVCIRYDNLFEVSFPYSAGMHQAPVNSGDFSFWNWHFHFYPPLLRSASVKKFMVGYEMLANPQRDVSAEWAAEQLRNQSEVHYKSKI